MRPPQRSRASRTTTRLPARHSSRAAMRPAGAAPTITKPPGSRETIDRCSPRLSAVAETIAQPQRAVLQRLVALQRHRLDRRPQVLVRLARVEDTRRALAAVHRRAEDEADLVDEPGPQEG